METKDGFLSACIQFSVQRGEVDANLREAEAGLRAAAEQQVKLAVLPEMWTTSFVPEIGAALIAQSEAADDHLIELSRENQRYPLVAALKGLAKIGLTREGARMELETMQADREFMNKYTKSWAPGHKAALATMRALHIAANPPEFLTAAAQE